MFKINCLKGFLSLKIGKNNWEIKIFNKKIIKQQITCFETILIYLTQKCTCLDGVSFRTSSHTSKTILIRLISSLVLSETTCKLFLIFYELDLRNTLDQEWNDEENIREVRLTGSDRRGASRG